MFIYDLFNFSLDELGEGTLIVETLSPNGKYTFYGYRNNPHSTVAFSVWGRVKDNETGKIKTIFYEYRNGDIVANWKDNENIIINDILLNVTEETYNSLD